MPLKLTQLFIEQAKSGWLRLISEVELDQLLNEVDEKLLMQQIEHEVFPVDGDLFRAFSYSNPDEIKVVIIGQDPYHGVGEANGLAFSVKFGQKLPPSLRNIYKEIANDLNCSLFQVGDLEPWAEQGVLLLNSVLTVNKDKAGSHQKLGWQRFTDSLIQKLSEQNQYIVFLLWGNYARAKKELITENSHLVLESAHPSPLSAYQGFFGNHQFSQANDFLRKQGRGEINWCT